MVGMVIRKHLDGATFRLFVVSGVWRHYGRHYLPRSQLDAIDEPALLARAGLAARQ